MYKSTDTINYIKKRKCSANIKASYENNIIDKVDNSRYLGLDIDSKLNWKLHIENLTKKICSSAYALYKLARIIDIDALLTAYYGLVASHIRYGIIFWGNSTDKKYVFNAQKRCIRAMFGLSPRDSCRPYFKKYRILTFTSMYILETALFVKNNPHLFQKLSVVRNRIRRDMDLVHVPCASTTFMAKSVVCMAPKIYNKIPLDIRLQNLSLFKKRLTNYLLEKCIYELHEFL